MVSLDLPAGFVFPPLSKSDLLISALAYGWTLGFGFLTARNAWKQFAAMRRPFRTSYFWFVMGELLGSQIMGFLFFLLTADKIQYGFWFLFSLLVTWVFQIQCLLQILINRVAIVTSNPKRIRILKWSIVVFIGLINVSVFVIWIPAHMGISLTWVKINTVWDRIEKILFLLVDLALNILFIRTVKERLVKHGLKKYDSLVTFNIRIIFISILMDALLIVSMSFTGGIVYGTIHPVTYLVKLNIELSLAKLITMIAKDKTSDIVLDLNEDTGNNSVTTSRHNHRAASGSLPYASGTTGRGMFSSHHPDEENQAGAYELKGRGNSVVVQKTQEVTVVNSRYCKDQDGQETTVSRSDSETRLQAVSPTTGSYNYSVNVSSRPGDDSASSF